MERVVLVRSNPVNPDPPVEKIADTLLQEGYEVTIVAWDRNENYTYKAGSVLMPHGTVRVIRFGISAVYGGGLKKSLPALTKFQYSLMKWLVNNRNYFDIIHAFDFDTGYVASICARMFQKKLVYHILDYYVASHNLSGGLIGRIIERAEINVINRADATIVCTEKRKEQISKAKPRNLSIIHNTPREHLSDCSKLVQDENHEKVRLVYVGSFGEDRFLAEVVEVIKSRNDVELHIGGFGEMESFIVENSTSIENILYYGRLSYEKTLALEKECDIMFAIYNPAVPNHKYAAPNKFYESLMLGKPIIMARNTGFDDIIIQNDIGEIIEYSIEGFHTAIERLISRRTCWKEMGNRARELYDNEFSWAIMEKRIAEIYSDMS